MNQDRQTWCVGCVFLTLRGCEFGLHIHMSRWYAWPHDVTARPDIFTETIVTRLSSILHYSHLLAPIPRLSSLSSGRNTPVGSHVQTKQNYDY